jgi:signal transduction histidine kinase
MLFEFVSLNREEIVRRCRAKVAIRSIPTPTAAEIDHGVPVFLDQLVEALRAGLSDGPDIGRTAILHGHDLLEQGFTVSQVVHDYGDVCQSITELASELDAPIAAADFRLLNACLDDAIASAVTEFGRQRILSTIEGSAARENERLGYFSHELRNLIQTATVAFEVLKTGNVGIAGSTGSVLARSLRGARELIARSLDEVRPTQGAQHRAVVLIADVVLELAPTAMQAADAAGVTLEVPAVDEQLAIEVDRLVVSAVIMNLLQNAFKFTIPGSTVTLRVRASADRVLIDVEDRCGGLPVGDVDDLFRPFEQRGANRTGLGLGLSFSRWAVEANSGRVYARSLPGIGCVFTIDLPRLPMSVGVTPGLFDRPA